MFVHSVSFHESWNSSWSFGWQVCLLLHMDNVYIKTDLPEILAIYSHILYSSYRFDIAITYIFMYLYVHVENPYNMCPHKRRSKFNRLTTMNYEFSFCVHSKYFAPLWSADPWWPMVLTQVVWGMKIIEKHDDATNFFRLWTWPRRCLAGELFFWDSLKIGEIPLCLTYQRQNPQKNDRWPKLFTSYLVKELGHVHPCAMQLRVSRVDNDVRRRNYLDEYL